VATWLPPIQPAPAALRTVGLILPILIAVLELLGGVRIHARVPDVDDYRQAAEYLKPRVAPRTLVVAAPPYVDPLVRHAMGDSLGLAQAAPSDLAPFETLYAMSVDGHFPASAPRHMPIVEKVFGRVSVLRWDLGPSPVVLELIDRLADARVETVVGERVTRCPKVEQRAFSSGGLSQGPMRPVARFECDRRKPHLYVGETVIEDLTLAPRRVVYQHPPDEGFVRTTFPPLEIARSLVLYTGLYYEHERRGEGAPFEVVVRIDGKERGRMVHRDRQGWKRLAIDTADLDGTQGTISIETFSREPRFRSVGWAATLRNRRFDEDRR
jgi:hypothetical protein